MKISQLYLLADSYEKINEIYECIQKSLIHLDISEFEPRKEEMNLLARVLPHLNNLESFKVTFNAFSIYDKFELFTEAFGSMNQLTELTVSYLKMNKKYNTICFSNALGKLKNLQILNIDMNDFNPGVVELFITKFSCWQKITDLTLSNSNLDNSSTDYLSKTMSQFPTLTVLGFVGKALFFDELIIYSRNLNSFSISSLILTDSRNIEIFPITIENLY